MSQYLWGVVDLPSKQINDFYHGKGKHTQYWICSGQTWKTILRSRQTSKRHFGAKNTGQSPGSVAANPWNFLTRKILVGRLFLFSLWNWRRKENENPFLNQFSLKWFTFISEILFIYTEIRITKLKAEWLVVILYNLKIKLWTHMNKLYLTNGYELSFASVFSNQRGSPPKYASRDAMVKNKRLSVFWKWLWAQYLNIHSNSVAIPLASVRP